MPPKLCWVSSRNKLKKILNPLPLSWQTNLLMLLVTVSVRIFYVILCMVHLYGMSLCFCRCPCDECNISHMITCGLISPEVSEELAATHQCRYQQRKQQEQMSSSVSSKSENNGQGTPGCLPSPTSLSQISSFSYDPMRYLVNVKPPSMPSSGSSSRSESPLMLDHYRFLLPFGDNFE